MKNLLGPVFVILFAPLMAQAADGQVIKEGALTYVSGGVGEDATAHMRTLARDFNLRLLFAAKDGHYLAEVGVVIEDARGAKVLETISEGPFLFAQLAPGKYQVRATYAQQSITRHTAVPTHAYREIIFRWTEDAD